MSNDSSDVDNAVRSRSLLRQVRETIGGINRTRNRTDKTADSCSLTYRFNTRGSLETNSITKKPIPNAFSNHLSLINQVKSHINKTRKTQNESESKSITPLDLNAITNDPCLSESVLNIDETMINQENSIDQLLSEEDSSQISPNRIQLSERARSSSLTSILTTNSEKIYWLELSIERGQDLSIKDFNGTSDPYVKVFYSGEDKYTTAIVHKNLNPIWNEKCSFFLNDLTIPICFHLFDYDRIGRDEPMGSTKIDLSKLPLDINYSATLNLENEKRTDGKIGMLKINLTISIKTSQFRDEFLRTINRQTSLSNRTVLSCRRTIDIFIIEARNLINPNGINRTFSPYIRLKFGTNKKYRTQTIKSTSNPKWHQSFIYDITNELPPLELTVLDDTNSSGELIGRAICNLTHLDEERTHRLSIDLDDNAGVIDLFVTITGITPFLDGTGETDSITNLSIDVVPSKLTNEDIETYSFLKTLKSITPINDVGKVEIKIYQARDLSAKDINGKSDPFCVIELDSSRLRTHTIYKTLDPIWNKTFTLPVQDIHSVIELTIFDEDTNQTTEFIGKLMLPLLAIANGERKWYLLKDRKCLLPVKGSIEIEATLIYTNIRAICRTFNPRQIRYYQQDGKFRVGVLKQHINRVRNMLIQVVDFSKFVDYCFQWENPLLSFSTFILSMIIVWNFQLYMFPCGILVLFAWNAIVQYQKGLLGNAFSTTEDETVSTVIQSTSIDEDVLDGDINNKEQKRSLMSVIHNIQDIVLEIQGYIDEVASTLERIKNLFNFTVPWLSLLAISVLILASIILYYIPLRYLVLAFVINKFTKRFRKPKGYIDNNELIDFLSRLPSDPELLQYRELKIIPRLPSPKKPKRTPANGK